MNGHRLRYSAAGLLLVAAALFAVGAAAERGNDSHDQTASATEPGSGEGALHHDETAEHVESAESHGEETVLGVGVESPVTVTIAVVVSVALAAGLALTSLRWMLVLATAVAGAFAALDVAEVVHQVDNSATGLALLAAAVALVHIGASTASAAALPRR